MKHAVRRPLFLLSLLGIVIGGGPLGSPGTARAEDAPAGGARPVDGPFVETALGNVRLGAPIDLDPIVLIPLEAAQAPTPLDMSVHGSAGGVAFVEPSFPTRRYDLEATNRDTRPVLLLAGTLLEGGVRDRFVLRDVLIPAGAVAEVPALRAAPSSSNRREAVPFRTSDLVAPAWLRSQALSGSSSSPILAFASKFLGFRKEGDTRESLIAVAEAPRLAEFCVTCDRRASSMVEVPAPRTVLGYVVVVRKNVNSIELFGTNALLRASFGPLLRGESFASAAIQLDAKDSGLEETAEESAKRVEHAVREAEAALTSLRSATLREDRGESVAEGTRARLLRAAGGLRGRAVGVGNRLVHLSVFGVDPFLSLLYHRDVSPDDADDPYASDGVPPGVSEGSRRAGLGARLTEFEKRYLERRTAPGGVGVPPR